VRVGVPLPVRVGVPLPVRRRHEARPTGSR
jgi:hypothetical protein